MVTLLALGRTRPSGCDKLPSEVRLVDLTVGNIGLTVPRQHLAGNRPARDEIVESGTGLQPTGPEVSLRVEANGLPWCP